MSRYKTFLFSSYDQIKPIGRGMANSGILSLRQGLHAGLQGSFRFSPAPHSFDSSGVLSDLTILFRVESEFFFIDEEL